MDFEIRTENDLLIAKIERADKFFNDISTSTSFRLGKPKKCEDRIGNEYYADIYICKEVYDYCVDGGSTKIKMYPNYYIKVIRK